jgi:hypothetical protein
MTSDRKKPGVAFWATVVVVVALVVYPLSFGPACWGLDRRIGDPCAIAAVYRPVLWLWVVSGPQWVGESISWYANLFAPNREWCVEPVDLDFIVFPRVLWR